MTAGSGRGKTYARGLRVGAAVVGAVFCLRSAAALAQGGDGFVASSEIAGLVEDAAGQPIEGADVVVTRPDGSARKVAITDATGAFALAPGDVGPLRVLVVTARGARVATLTLELIPGSRVELRVREGDAGSPLAIAGPGTAFAQGTFIALPAAAGAAPRALGLARDRDLAGALVGLPGTAPAAAPAGEIVLGGLAAAEVPLRFGGFLLNDPVDGAAPLDLPVTLFEGMAFARGPAPALALFAPRPQSSGGQLAVGGALATRARGADGAARPSGSTTAWSAAAGLDGRSAGASARGALRVAPQRNVWQADPESVTAARGRRKLVVPVLAWGQAEAGGWQLDGGGLGSFAAVERGRAGRILPPDEPAGGRGTWWLLGATARRQLAAGRNDLALQAGFLRADRRRESAGLPAIDQTGSRLTLAAALHLAGRWGVWHLFGLATGLDLERADRSGGGPSRQPGAVDSGADASAKLPWFDVSERLVPVHGFEIEVGLHLGLGLFEGRSGFLGASDVTRSFSTDLQVAPRARLQWRPLDWDLALYAAAGRRGVALPLDALMGPAAQPRSSLSAPAEDALTLGAIWQGESQGWGALTLALSAHASRAAALVEDRFSPTSGQLELFAPRDAERRTRALVAEAAVRWPTLRAGIAAVLARQEGNDVGFVDEGTGQLHPAGTAAFDGPDVEGNRSGPLPFDRPYGLRGFVEGTLPATLPAGLALSGAVRGRLDAGTPRAATARSATSGPGQVFLVERGSLGRTSPSTDLDAAVTLSRGLGERRVWLTLEGFNLTQHRPVVTRDAVFSDAVLAPAPGGRGFEGLAAARDAAGTPAQPSPDFGRAVAYAEPLLLRLLVGCAF